MFNLIMTIIFFTSAAVGFSLIFVVAIIEIVEIIKDIKRGRKK